ncbi:GIY-YIG nuclease family protein [Paragemmobacter straminiformis]|uniref:GIY-YIG nuclease family protein n=1 Tax=Paragemmobacter straminiformis TaxID=2045119 RepID=UPI0019D62638
MAQGVGGQEFGAQEFGFVYVLGSDGAGGYRTYVGWTLDLGQRVARHNAGTGAKSTRGRVWAVLYAERLPSRAEAMSREWYLKRDRALRRRLALVAQGLG